MSVKLPLITEAEFLDQVLQYAKLRGWFVVHFRPARTRDGWRTAVSGDGVGWLDLFGVRGAQRFAAELKVGNNKLTGPQIDWMNRLEAAGIPAYTWRPTDWAEIEMVLA